MILNKQSIESFASTPIKWISKPYVAYRSGSLDYYHLGASGSDEVVGTIDGADYKAVLLSSLLKFNPYLVSVEK